MFHTSLTQIEETLPPELHHLHLCMYQAELDYKHNEARRRGSEKGAGRRFADAIDDDTPSQDSIQQEKHLSLS